MSVMKLVANGAKPGALREFAVEGTTYSPVDGGIVGWSSASLEPNLQSLAEVAAVCNDAGVMYNGGVYKATGLPTEAALKVCLVA